MPWQTYWLEPSGRGAAGLRRYARPSGSDWAWECAVGWHSALAWTGEVDCVAGPDGCWPRLPETARDAPGWPEVCDRGCGYRFGPDDAWQDFLEPLYRRADTGAIEVLHLSTNVPPQAVMAAPGASWDAVWMSEHWRGPDGRHLTVRCPNMDGSPGGHDWPVDGPSSRGGRWTRTGDPTRGEVHVNPSIAIGRPEDPRYYHGWLHGGVLSDHLG